MSDDLARIIELWPAVFPDAEPLPIGIDGDVVLLTHQGWKFADDTTATRIVIGAWMDENGTPFKRNRRLQSIRATMEQMAREPADE